MASHPAVGVDIGNVQLAAPPAPVRLVPAARGDSAASVLYVVDTLNIGGTEKQLVQTAIRLHRTGQHQVTVACLRAEGPLLAVLQRAGVRVMEFPKGKTLLSANGVRQLLRLAFFIRKERFQAVHAYDLWANLLGVPAAWLARTPVIIASRRYLADLDWYTPWRNKLLCMVYHLSTYVTVNSNVVRDLLVQRDGLCRKKVRVIYNGVDADGFVPATHAEKTTPEIGCKRKVIVLLANMYSELKGHHSLIQAAQMVCRDISDAIFVLVGDGQGKSKLQDQAKAEGLQQKILFLGGRNDVPQILACCTLFVLPSEAEAMPNALLEAMAAGLPVVATRVGGVPEVVEDGVNGLLVPPRDPRALADAILRILADPGLSRNLAQAGRETIRAYFTFDRLIAELAQLYKGDRCTVN